ncbi:Lanosterol synthase (Oxidosqualene--lanosterol cyclase) [Tilletia horrida]|nr:Lanosterol synthase (Oxidosqualene--lanosterol cyclase) [Tilletia horrida]
MSSGQDFDPASMPRTDSSRWRLRSGEEGGRHVWVYLKTEEEAARWPQSVEDRYWMGLSTDAPELPKATSPLQAARNGWSFYKLLQSSDGHWAGEYGGPMFLLPGLIIAMYVTKTPIPDEWRIEILRYLANRANKQDGGWGIHIEGVSTVFGTALNYVVCRILGMDPEHPVAAKARACLHKLGGATGIPSWGKTWLALLNCYDWEGLNPVPPELWLLPKWVPIHPWRWWIHTRMVYIPVGYLYGKRFKAPIDPLIESLRQELYVEPYESIHWPSQRENVAEVDIFYPHTKVLKALMAVLGGYESCCAQGVGSAIRNAGIREAYRLIVEEDENTGYQCLGPVNKALNFVARWIEEGDEPGTRGGVVMKIHREKLKDFMWLGSEGMMMTGTNGSQLWDSAFVAQALADSDLLTDANVREPAEKLLDWLDKCQIQNNPKHHHSSYRFATKGAWPFSTKEQSYVVSDCTAEGMKAVMELQAPETGLKPKVSIERLRASVDLLLTMQNPSGGFASYETINGPKILEWINPAEVFGDIMIEYDYPECTTSVVTSLMKFKAIDDYRTADIERCVSRAVKYILKAQRPDGSWFGSWGICFTYAMMFSLESLHEAGYSYANSEEVQRACQFLLSKQMADGGWGETYMANVTGQWVNSDESQVVQTAFALIALLHAGYPELEPIKRGVELIMSRQQADGSWKQELIEGIFNRRFGNWEITKGAVKASRNGGAH